MRDTVGPYKLLERTGEDSVGETWRARDTARGRTVLVRVVHAPIAGDPARRSALISAAHLAAAISHPSVAALFDVVDQDDALALAHEHVEGRSLAATLGGTALNARTAAAIGIQLADGLAELEANGMAHGAVDAAHVVITPRGQAKLIDAGLIGWLADAPAPADDLAAIGRLVGSMFGESLPPDQWARDLRDALDRTAPGRPRRFQAMATFAAELRSIAAMLEARAEAMPAAAAGSGRAAVFWGALGILLLVAGAWFLLR